MLVVDLATPTRIREEFMKQERIDPGWAWARKLNISVGVKIGDTIYLSGIVAFDGDGNVMGGDDVYAQATQTFKNIETALAGAGATMADVVKITTFLTDMSGYADFGRARTEAFPAGVPASAAYTTPALVKPELLVEVEAIAVVGSGD
jgi:enamine deaminase RidA (YjgF/YER057c/UK114 family)